MEINRLLSAIVFSTSVGFLLDLAGYTSFTLITPTLFAAGQVLLTAAIAVANTPIAKGAAMAVFSGWLILYFVNLQIPLPSPTKEIIYALLFVPSFLAIGLTFLELGKG